MPDRDGWIRVEERLPPLYQPAWFANEWGRVFRGMRVELFTRNADTDYWHIGDSGAEIVDRPRVTHFRPERYPAPPREGGG